MTLKEKFNNALDLDNDKYITYECEEIADEFAIGFADWFFEHCYEDQVGYYKAEELLEIYKKGL
jgi:hypothetical protein